MSGEIRTIAVIGATGQQGGAVVDALLAQGKFRVRALTRHPGAYTGGAHEVRKADLADPATLNEAMEGAFGVFAVTNFWEKGTDEIAQGEAAIAAAKQAGVSHFVWSSLPDVAAISGGKYAVHQFTNKAQVNKAVSAAGFPYSTIVEAPFYFSNLTGQMTPQPLGNRRQGWAIPIAADARVIHMGDIADLGAVVAGTFAHPEVVGQGQRLSVSGDLMSFSDIAHVLNGLGHDVEIRQVPPEVYAGFFPGAFEMMEMMRYWTEYTYFGPDAEAKIALARKVSTAPAMSFSAWAKRNMPAAELA